MGLVVEPGRNASVKGVELRWWCTTIKPFSSKQLCLDMYVKMYVSLFAWNACCLLVRLLIIWISCPFLCAQLSPFFPIFLDLTHTHTPLFSAFFLLSSCGPLAQLASVDYRSLTAIMILHKQHLSAHLSLFPPGCPLSSIHLRSISASLPLGWKYMLPPQLKITPKSPL